MDTVGAGAGVSGTSSSTGSDSLDTGGLLGRRLSASPHYRDSDSSELSSGS